MRHALRFRSHLPHWLVIWTILLAALVPAVAPWMARAQVRSALPGAEVCSAARHSAPASPKKDADQASQGKHCVLCVHETNSAGLPPQAIAFAPGLNLAPTAPRQGHSLAGATPSNWSRPLTRAPPVSLV